MSYSMMRGFGVTVDVPGESYPNENEITHESCTTCGGLPQYKSITLPNGYQSYELVCYCNNSSGKCGSICTPKEQNPDRLPDKMWGIDQPSSDSDNYSSSQSSGSGTSSSSGSSLPASSGGRVSSAYSKPDDNKNLLLYGAAAAGIVALAFLL